MRIRRESVVTIFYVMIALFSAAIALTWDFKTALVPLLCSGTVGVLSFIQLMKELRGKEKKDRQIMDTGFSKETTDRENLTGALQYFGWLVGLYLSILLLGLYPSIALFVVLYLQASGKVSLGKSVATAGVILAVVYVIVTQVAQEVLPDPILYKLIF